MSNFARTVLAAFVDRLAERRAERDALANAWEDGYDAGHRDRGAADEIDADWPTPNPYDHTERGVR